MVLHLVVNLSIILLHEAIIAQKKFPPTTCKLHKDTVVEKEGQF